MEYSDVVDETIEAQSLETKTRILKHRKAKEENQGYMANNAIWVRINTEVYLLLPSKPG